MVVIGLVLLILALAFSTIFARRVSALNREHRLPMSMRNFPVKPPFRVMIYQSAAGAFSVFGALVLNLRLWEPGPLSGALLAGATVALTMLIPPLVVIVAHNRRFRAE